MLVENKVLCRKYKMILCRLSHQFSTKLEGFYQRDHMTGYVEFNFIWCFFISMSKCRLLILFLARDKSFCKTTLYSVIRLLIN